MGIVKNLWRTLTHTKALEQSSGKLETVFFESAYRVTYIIGLSWRDRSFGYLLYSTIVRVMIVAIVLGEAWYACTQAKGLDEVASTINVMVIQFITMYRYKNMIEHKDFYTNLATTMGSPYFDITMEKRKKLVNMWALKTETYLKRLFVLGDCTLTAWFTFPFLDDIEYNHLIGIRLPFCDKTPFRYALAYIMVAIPFYYISHFVMVVDCIMQAHLIHLLCQFSVLADCFENLFSECSIGFEGITQNDLIHNKQFADKYRKRLGDLVKQHNFILSHTMKLRDILSAPMLGQLAASGTLICFVGYQTATTIQQSPAKCLMSFLYLAYNVFELYLICKWCEEITNWSQKIGDAIYCSGWECGVAKIRGVRSTIMFIIARANNPLVFTAGGMYNLSIASYARLIKASYTALTVLLRFR